MKEEFGLCKKKKETNDKKTEQYELKSSKTLKQVNELIPFENYLIALVQNIKIQKNQKSFPEKDEKKHSVN